MNLTILFRGPIRPNYENILKNIRSFKNNFNDFKIESHLVTYNPINKKIFKNEIQNFILLNEPKNEEINLNKKYFNFNAYNCYKQFYSANYALKTIKKNSTDIIVHMRTDMQLVLDKDQHFLAEGYTTIHSKTNGDLFTNDQFGISNYEIMKKVWCYENKNVLENFICTVEKPEDIIDINICKNNIKCYNCKFTEWKLDPRRK